MDDTIDPRRQGWPRNTFLGPLVRPILGAMVLGAVSVNAVSALPIEASSGLFAHDGENDNTVTTATLEAPDVVVVQDEQQTSLEVEWVPSDSGFVTGYQLYRSTDPGGPYGAVGGPLGSGTLSLTDGGLAPATTYYYVVEAIANDWVSDTSMEAQGTTLP